MKKLFALVLALCLLCGVAAAETAELNWTDVAPILEAGGVTGDFYTFDAIAVKIFVPSDLQPQELPNENYIGYFAAEDGSALAVQYVNVNGASLEDYAAVLPEAGAAEIEMGTLNGMPCVTYELPETKVICVAFATEAGYILEAVCGPYASDEEKTAAGMILASIQPNE